MRRPLALLLVGVLTIPSVLTAQAVSPGSRVRVTDPAEGTRIGTVVAVTPDTLEVRFAHGSEPTPVAIARVTRLDVSRGRERRTMGRAALGVVVGAGVGSLIGAISASDCPTGVQLCPSARGNRILSGGTLLGSVGGVIGLIAGRRPAELWEQVPLERRRIVLVAPTRGHGSGVGLSFDF